jgi:hypothetical protein
MPEPARLISQFYSPAQRRMVTWRTAADEVWRTWEEVRHAPRALRPAAYQLHLRALDAEARAASALPADGGSGTTAALPGDRDLAA